MSYLRRRESTGETGTFRFVFFVIALRAMAYGGGSFSIDMNVLRAMAGISRREIKSIERIRWMNCFVRRTLTAIKLKYTRRNYPNFRTEFLTDHFLLDSLSIVITNTKPTMANTMACQRYWFGIMFVSMSVFTLPWLSM